MSRSARRGLRSYLVGAASRRGAHARAGSSQVARLLGAAAGLVGHFTQAAGAGEPRPASPIDPGSVEAEWIGRAWRAAARSGEVALGLTQDPLAGRAELLRLKMTETVAILERLAVRSSVARRVLERTDAHALGVEAEWLRAEHRLASGTTAALVGRSLGAVEARVDLHRQLRRTRDGVLARLEMGVVHIERVSEGMTRVAVASVLAPEPPVAELDELYESLVAIRPGLLADEPDLGAPAQPAAAPPHQATTAAG